MNATLSTTSEITFEQVFSLAQLLRPVDQARLVARLAPKVEWLLTQVESTLPPLARQPLRGLLADLGPAPSAEDIDQVQQEMWSSFSQDEK